MGKEGGKNGDESLYAIRRYCWLLFRGRAACYRRNFRFEPFIFNRISRRNFIRPRAGGAIFIESGSVSEGRPSVVRQNRRRELYIGIEATATSNVIVRDKDGNLLFAVDQSSRTTTVGKSKGRAAGPTPAVEQELPDGCEGAFSPYVNPSKARVIGRCVSGLSSSRNRVG